MITVLVAGLLVLLLATAAMAAARVRRLHRLHQRLDAARAALDAALARRAEVALRAAAVLDGGVLSRAAPGSLPPAADDPQVGGGLAAAARRAGRRGPWGPAREDAENALGRALARLDRTALPPSVAAELTDAERLALLGRAVHNDAVRDALALRTRRLVRWLRLSGTAPMPTYTDFT